MVHRRLLTDGDHKGVGEPLNDSSVVTTRQNIIYGALSGGIYTVRDLALKKEHPPVVLFSTSPSAPVLEWAPLATDLPENLHLETLQALLLSFLLNHSRFLITIYLTEPTFSCVFTTFWQSMKTQNSRHQCK